MGFYSLGSATVDVDKIEGLDAWDATVIYATGENVKESGKIWESLQDGNLNHLPSSDNPAAPVYWKEVSASHVQNTDTALRLSNGNRLLADEIARRFLLPSTVVFVSKSGNNSTALAGRMDYPFLTISAACAAGGAGKTVVVMGGTYNEQVTIASGQVNRILLWFGAVITSSALHTIACGHNGLTIEGMGTKITSYIAEIENAIINTHVDGKCIVKGDNPGAVIVNLKNVSLRSESSATSTTACCFSNCEVINADGCKFYAASCIIRGNVQGTLTNCYFDSNGYIYDDSVYAGLTQRFEGCFFSSANGIRGSLRSCVFIGGSMKTTVGGAIFGYNQGDNVRIEKMQITAQTFCIGGEIGSFEVVGCYLRSVTAAPWTAYPFNWYTPSTSWGDIRDTKLIAEATQTYALANPNGSYTKINLINVVMNKGYNNVTGIISGVVVDSILKGF